MVMINSHFTLVKIVVIQPLGCKGNFNKTIYLSTILSLSDLGSVRVNRL